MEGIMVLASRRLRHSKVELRSIPMQSRSSKRIEDLLDGAANLIEKVGIISLSTSSIAQTAGSSVGVFYRYFPNLESVLRALAERNFERFLTQMAGKTASTDLNSAMICNVAVETYIQMCVQEPGFRLLRFGAEILAESSSQTPGAETTVSQIVSAYFDRPEGIPRNSCAKPTLHTGILLGFAIVDRAFLSDRGGNESLIELARTLPREFLAEPLRNKKT